MSNCLGQSRFYTIKQAATKDFTVHTTSTGDTDMGDNAFQFQQKSQLNLELCGVSSVLQVPSFTATVNDTSSDQTSDSSESVDHHKVHSVNTEAALLHYCNYITQKKQRLNSKKKKKNRLQISVMKADVNTSSFFSPCVGA